MAGFYKCQECGTVVYVLSGDGSKLPLKNLVANSIDASKEKHVPFVTVEENKIKVQVGEVLHPMLAEHYIEWIAAEGDDGMKISYLKPGEVPEATFCNKNNWIKRVYAYCNLHGLWVKEL